MLSMNIKLGLMKMLLFFKKNVQRFGHKSDY